MGMASTALKGRSRWQVTGRFAFFYALLTLPCTKPVSSSIHRHRGDPVKRRDFWPPLERSLIAPSLTPSFQQVAKVPQQNQGHDDDRTQRHAEQDKPERLRDSWLL